jgi:hypothetical protein
MNDNTRKTARRRKRFNAPWSLHFDRDGTEDIAIICDADGNDLAHSRHFWLPEGDDPIPLTLAAMRLMTAAPKMLAALRAFIEADAKADECHEWKWDNLDHAFGLARAAIAEATAGRRP